MRQGLMVGRVAPNPPTPKEGTLRWHMVFDESIAEQLTYYIDGSGIHAVHSEYARFGFAVVAVDSHGALRGLANGTVPHYVRSSAEAELWAYYQVLQMTTFAPNVVTDCLGILETLKRGLDKATARNAAMARVLSV